MAKVNTHELKRYLDQQGEGAISKLADQTGISIHTLMKMAYGTYHSNPSRLTRRALAEATQIPEHLLFKKVEEAS